MQACGCASLTLWAQDATESWPPAGGAESEASLERACDFPALRP